MQEVNVSQLYQIIGAQNVEIMRMRGKVQELEAMIAALTPAQTPLSEPPAA